MTTTAYGVENTQPFYPALDGTPLQGGSVWFGVAGQNPVTNPQTVYSDAAATQPVAQPVAIANGRTVDANGNPIKIYATGAFSRLVQDRLGRTILFEQSAAPSCLAMPLTPQAFGAVGDGVKDDTVAMTAFFAGASGRVCILPAGTYRLNSLITVALTNCRFIGVPGQTVIVGNFGYAVLRLLDLNNVTFEGVEFKTEYASAVEDLGASVVYSYQNSVTDTHFRRCKFTAPNANTGGFTVYARVNAGDTSGTIDGLWVEDCDFTDVGRIGCTIMNRNTGAYTAAQRVYFNRNKGSNLGTQGSYGFLVSFDGYGQHFTCDENLVQGALGIGIENTNWCNGQFKGNRFRDFSKVYAPMSFSGVSSGLTIEGNQTMEPANSRSNFIGVSNSRFRGNFLQVTGDYAFHLRDGSSNVLEGDTYKSDNIYAALIGLTGAYTTADNRFNYCTFDDSASGANTSTVRFDGTGTTRNVLSNCTIKKGTGGSLTDQTNSALANKVRAYLDGVSTTPAKYLSVSMSDADYTFSSQNQVIRYDSYRFNGTLTAARTVYFPDDTDEFWVFNNTNHDLTVQPASGASGNGVVVYAGQRAFVWSDGAGNFRGAGTVGAGWNNTQGLLVLGDYQFWVDSSGRLRIKNGAPTSDTDGTVVGTQS